MSFQASEGATHGETSYLADRDFVAGSVGVKTSDDTNPLPRVSRAEIALQDVEALATVYDRMTRAQLADARRLVRQWAPVDSQP